MKHKSYYILLFCFFTGHIAFTQPLSPIVDSIPMRDGKVLAADIYLPDPSGSEEYSTILIQTPYSRKLYRWTGLPLGIGKGIDTSRYAFVIVDWRCFFGSLAACVLNLNRGEDGFDVVDWISQQEWSNGRIGTWGPSALGRVQFMTEKEHPPNLICMVPLVAGPQYKYLEYYPGGVKRTEFVEQIDLLGFGIGQLIDDHPVYDTVWEYTEATSWYPEDIQIPSLMIGGWYDHNTRLIMEFYQGLVDFSPVDEHYLLFGPWAHGSVGDEDQGELSYPEAAGWSDSLAIMFFDYYLENIQNGWNERDKITTFSMGENNWHFGNTWPSEDTVHTKYYMHQDGMLSVIPPSASSASLSFPYNPKDPSPTIGGATLKWNLEQGPYDQAPIVEARNDVVIFSTETLQNKVTLGGKPSMHLSVSSNRLDTDFAVRLTDVYPDGRSMLLYSGIHRMRFRNGYTAEDTSNIIPGEIYGIDVDFPALCNTFLPGHKIRIDLTSSNYPRFDCNLNNGGPMYAAGDSLIANNTVFTNSINLSWLELPVIPNNVGLNEVLQNNSPVQIKVYPNPAPADATIEVTSDRETSGQLILLDITGRIIESVFDGKFYCGKNTFTMNPLKQKGIYLVMFNSGTYNIVTRVTFN